MSCTTASSAGWSRVRAEVEAFAANMLYQMAEMSCEDGLVMQIHPGVLRDHNSRIWKTYGSDKGYDIPIQTEFTRALRPMLDRFGTDPRFRVILFTVDETVYSRELAPIAGTYPSVRLGAPWWFLDSRGHAPVPGARRRDRRLLQHLRLCGRYAGVRLHTRSPRPLSSRRRWLSRASGPGASAQLGRGSGDGHRPDVQPAQGVLRRPRWARHSCALSRARRGRLPPFDKLRHMAQAGPFLGGERCQMLHEVVRNDAVVLLFIVVPHLVQPRPELLQDRPVADVQDPP